MCVTDRKPISHTDIRTYRHTDRRADELRDRQTGRQGVRDKVKYLPLHAPSAKSYPLSHSVHTSTASQCAHPTEHSGTSANTYVLLMELIGFAAEW